MIPHYSSHAQSPQKADALATGFPSGAELRQREGHHLTNLCNEVKSLPKFYLAAFNMFKTTLRASHEEFADFRVQKT